MGKGKVNGFSRSRSSYARSKRRIHHCPKCGSTVSVKEVSQVVNLKSEEAKNFDFSPFSTSGLGGNINFIWDVFYCLKCDIQISIKEMQAYEKKQRALRGEPNFGDWLDENPWFRLLLFITVFILFLSLIAFT